MIGKMDIYRGPNPKKELESLDICNIYSPANWDFEVIRSMEPIQVFCPPKQTKV